MEGTLEEVLDCKFHIAKRWIRLLQHGFIIPDYFESHGISFVIIYGITDFALSILEEYRIAEKLGAVRAISDKKITGAEAFDYCGIPCVSPDNLPEYDGKDTVVIVTPMGWHKEIKYELENCGLKHVMTIQEIIYDMCSEMKKTEIEGFY